MSSNNSDDKPASSNQPREPETNPFIAFRHHVDQQINSLIGSVFSIPSAIYNQGAQHGRTWSERRQARLRDASSQDDTRDIGTEWEKAMKDFEDTEREAKEWYDTVLRQITERRDAHLESGLGFGGRDAKSSETEAPVPEEQPSCPYLPPKEQRESLPQESKSDGWRCRSREHPHSRFFDWIWTGWGGPSTTPNMLWHQERRGQESQSSTHVDAEEHVESTEPVGDAVVAIRTTQRPRSSGQVGDVFAALEAMSTPLWMRTEENSEQDAFPETSDPLSMVSWYTSSSYSPLRIESNPHIGDWVSWRSAYEDLLRSQIDEPLTTDQEAKQTDHSASDLWILRMVELHAMGSVDQQSRDTYKSLRPQLHGLFSRAMRPFTDEDALDKSSSWEDLMWKIFSAEQAAEPSSEQDMYDHFLKERASSKEEVEEEEIAATEYTSSKLFPSARASVQPGKPSILDSLTRTERVHNPDGTVTERTVLKTRFSDGQQTMTESTKTTDKNGATLSERTETTEGPAGSAPLQLACPLERPTATSWPTITATDNTGERDIPIGALMREFERTVPELEQEQRPPERKKPKGGWFWKS